MSNKKIVTIWVLSIIAVVVLVFLVTYNSEGFRRYHCSEILKNGSPEDAYRCFGEWAKLKPNDISVQIGFGIAAKGNKRKEEALEIFKNTLNLNASDEQRAIVWGQMGEINMDFKEYDDSLSAYNNALKLEPKNCVYLIGAAKGMAFKGDLTTAVNILKYAVSLEPENLDVWWAMGAVCDSFGVRDGVLKVIEVLKKLDPETAKRFQENFDN